MSDRMIGVRVSVTRYIADEPIPGVVECELLDANGRRWSFVEKTAHVSAEILDAESCYPRPGAIACEIVGRSQDSTGRETVLIDTECPWCVDYLKTYQETVRMAKAAMSEPEEALPPVPDELVQAILAARASGN